MALPLRKVRLKSAGDDVPKRRLTFSLSRLSLGALGLALLAVVGWAFYMGFMVGRGQNPEKRVEQMTGMLRDKPQAPAGQSPLAPPAPGAPLAPEATAPAPAPTAAAMGAALPAGQAGQGTPNQPQPPARPALPFSRPQGDSMGAWGIKNQAQAPGQASQGVQTGQNAQATNQAPAQAAAKPAPQAKEPLFDYVYQVAAFKDKNDSDKLRASLEGRGLRTRQQNKGTLILVMVSLRGTEQEAVNLREDLKRMKLGNPLLSSKKPVASAKPRKAGR